MSLLGPAIQLVTPAPAQPHSLQAACTQLYNALLLGTAVSQIHSCSGADNYGLSQQYSLPAQPQQGCPQLHTTTLKPWGGPTAGQLQQGSWCCA